jgi:hypothetical protein
MSPSDILIDGGEVVLSIAAVFIALLALNLRRALIDRTYKTRALWTAVGALTLISIFVANYADTIYMVGPIGWTNVIVETTVWGFTFLGLYGWIVSNANVAILADYFNRDALGWKRGGMIVSTVTIVVLFIFYNFPPWLEPPALANGTGWGAIVDSVASYLGYVPVIYAAGVLVICYRRISDQRIKTYTKWVVASITSLFLTLFVPSIAAVVPAVLWVYCMYRTVGALAIKVRTLPS